MSEMNEAITSLPFCTRISFGSFFFHVHIWKLIALMKSVCNGGRGSESGVDLSTTGSGPSTHHRHCDAVTLDLIK